MTTNHDGPTDRSPLSDGFDWAREAPGPGAVGVRPGAESATEPSGRDRAARRTPVHERSTQHPADEAPAQPAPARPAPKQPAPPAGTQPGVLLGSTHTPPAAAPGEIPAPGEVPGPAGPRSHGPAQMFGAQLEVRGGHPLSASSIVRTRPPRPRHGWRGALYTLSGGMIAPRLSPVEVRRQDQVRRVRTPLPGPLKITVASMKGGVGKTTIAGVLGLTLAEHRGDRAIAIDANPDAGTLADRLVGEGPGPTIRELINDLDRVTASTALARYTRLAGRLHVLPSEQDPAMSEQFNRAEYEAVIGLLEQFYDILITDSGTGVVHSAMSGALDRSDQLVIVGAPTVDAASRAAKTLDWLIEHDFADLVSDAVVALSRDRESPDVDRGQIRDYFAARCRAVVEIPYDDHLRTGGVIDLGLLGQATLDGALELTAHVADGFYDHHSTTPPVGAHPGRRR